MSAYRKSRETQSAVYDIDTYPFYMRDSEGRLSRATSHGVMHHIVHALLMRQGLKDQLEVHSKMVGL